MAKSYTINVPNDTGETVTSAIDIQSNATRVMPFTGDVFDWNEYVKSLDRYDSFSRLLISPYKYAETDVQSEPRICYGIPPRPAIHHGGAPVLNHQKNAALMFLKDLRGFGLLADVVGSGKTFEAGVAISELAARDRISSVLFIVPKQVYGDWVRTMESFFGMGKDESYWATKESDRDPRIPSVLKPVGTSLNRSDFAERDGFYVPNAPMIVTKEDFVKWSEADVENKLFDIIVVDEAHFLNSSEGENSKAMFLLSLLMQTKKEAAKNELTKGQYCLLLSATPHNGNLADMFRLWYFIRFNGGDPRDFDPQQLSHTPEFDKERSYYLNKICVGATTITDFVRKKKIIYVYGSSEPEQREYVLVIRRAFAKYLLSRGINDFDTRSEGAKETLINEFLDLDSSKEHKERVKREIASDYHNDVLGTIMVRQSKDKVDISRARKRAINLFYLHTDNNAKAAANVWDRIPGFREPQEFSVELKRDGVSVLHESVFKPQGRDGQLRRADGTLINMSLLEYVEYVCRSMDGFENMQDLVYAAIMKNMLSYFSLKDNEWVIDEGSKLYNSRFHRANSLSFFYDQLLATDMQIARDDNGQGITSDVEYSIEAISQATSDFDHKYSKLCKILRRHKDERVVVFFDYSLPEDKSICSLVYNKILKDSEFASRVISLDDIPPDVRVEEYIKKSFDAKENSIFIATNERYTEGANLQSGHVIVNLQVPANPLDMQQRIGRVFRIGQESDVLIYSIANVFDLEGYLLSYYTRIGLMSGNTGDAEILAGCNNENMVATRCRKPDCGFVQLVSREDFEAWRDHKCPGCSAINTMSEITTRIFRCSNKQCGAILERETDKNKEPLYRCISKGGYLFTNSTDDRKYYCSKVCSLLHCKRIATRLSTKCPVLAEYEIRKSFSGVEVKCNSSCPNFNDCKSFGCTIGQGIDACTVCEKKNGYKHTSCNPAPMTLEFNDKWETDCPVCKTRNRRGVLSPIKNSSFESFICGLYQFVADGGESFCGTFQREIDKVSDIRDILQMDTKREG